MQDIESLGRDLLTHARTAYRREVLVLSGERQWCQTQARALIAVAGSDAVWVGEGGTGGVTTVTAGQCGAFLGRELAAAVFDAWSGFDPDAFGQISGAVRGGGLFVLLAPPVKDWEHYDDPQNERIAVAPGGRASVTGRFLHRIARIILASQEVRLIEQDQPLPELPGFEQPPVLAPHADDECRTPDQQLAVEAVRSVAVGRRRHPLVLTSDRGRGKSAALGIAAAHLLRQGLKNIVVTAPRPEAAEQVFSQAARLLPAAHATRTAVRFNDASIRFVAPDELVRSSHSADLLLVDEAAAIPGPLLESFLHRYARIVFATTVHGYEGTGRGFAVRFHQVLDEQTPGWRNFRLRQPIRWASDDPLERFVFQALLLDAAPAADSLVQDASVEACSLEVIDRNRLAEDEKTLRELFGLLVIAHYRTRPLDLRHMLDGPNVSIWVLRFDGSIVAASLVSREGGFSAALSHDIWEGRRRPRGHLIPQSLAVHVGLAEGAMSRGDRVMRIAVHPAVQGSGLGSHLITSILKQARSDGMDYVGSSFGATPQLLRFWNQLGFRGVRVGMGREASSGAHSVMVLHPLSDRGIQLFERARRRFTGGFVHLLSDSLKDIEHEVVLQLVRVEQASAPVLDSQDWLDVLAFACANRGYESAIWPIWKLVCSVVADPAALESLDEPARVLLVKRVLQRCGWSEAAATAGLPGRRQAILKLRNALRLLLKAYAPLELNHGLKDCP